MNAPCAMPSQSPAGEVAALLRWFKRNKRAMPWRENRSPYAVWVSEIMLQQTQVNTVRPYFDRFMARFPSVAALAAAPLESVLKAWEGLGYYARARNLHRAATQVVSLHGGVIPCTAAELRGLAGIGEYTAAAIASICWGEAVPVVDGNVLRVFSRVWQLNDDIRLPRSRRAVSERLAAIMPRDEAGPFNEAVMELGALVCRPVDPDCAHCPLRPACGARRAGQAARYPVKSPAKPIPHLTIAVGAALRAGRLLVVRRPEDGMLGGLWELPGGPRQGREPLAETVRRELAAETGVAVEVGRRLCVVRHAYSHFRITLHAFACTAPAGRLLSPPGKQARWASRAELAKLPFSTVSRHVLDHLEASYSHVGF